MRNFLFLLLFHLATYAQAQYQPQPKAVRLYRYNDQVVMSDSLGQSPVFYPASQVAIKSARNLIEVVVGSASVFYRPNQLLNASGTAYGSTVTGAINTYLTTTSASGLSAPTIAGTSTVSRVSDSGTIASGALFVSIYNAGSANGTVMGATIEPGISITFPALISKTYGAISYSASGTTFLIQATR